MKCGLRASTLVSTIINRENLFRWLVAIGCFATVIFFFSPSWGAFTLWERVPEMSGMLEVRRGAVVLDQVVHPGAEISDPLHRVIQWRLLFPLVGHVLHLPSPLLFGLADLGCVFVLGYIIILLRRSVANTTANRSELSWTDTALTTIALGAASWIFVSTGWLGYYDSWLALGLLIVTFARSSWPLWLACVWAPWVDERFVMAAPLALFCRWLWRASSTAPASPRPGINAPSAGYNVRREIGIAAALLAAFAFVRLGLLSGTSAANATVAGYFSGKNYLDAPFGRILLGVWEGLRAGWVFVVAAIFLLRPWPLRAAILGVAVVLTVVLGLATAQDYSRSMTMLLPVAVLGAVLVVRARPPRQRLLLQGAAIVALILPAHHVMNDRVNPIFYLYHEIAAMESPPPTAMPELRELSAMHLIEQGKYGEAEHELTLAIKLSEDPASPAKARGRLYASAQRWADAKRDFTLVVQHEPDDPEGWFLRSEVELAVRDLDAARSDFEHARSLGGENFASRPDVKRIGALIEQAGRR